PSLVANGFHSHWGRFSGLAALDDRSSAGVIDTQAPDPALLGEQQRLEVSPGEAQRRAASVDGHGAEVLATAVEQVHSLPATPEKVAPAIDCHLPIRVSAT